PDRPPKFAPGAEFLDHRRLGFGSIRGADALLRGFRSQFEVADDITVRIDDVLGLRSNVLLTRRTFSGTARAGGGAYESPGIGLCVFSVDGLITRQEYFDVDREDDALARFDELAAEPPAARSATAPVRAIDTHTRRVRPNAATANAARQVAAVAARDADAPSTLWADGSEFVHHATGRTYDRRELLAFWRLFLTKTKGANL